MLTVWPGAQDPAPQNLQEAMGSVLERPQVEPLMLNTVVSTGLLLVFGQDSPSSLSPPPTCGSCDPRGHRGNWKCHHEFTGGLGAAPALIGGPVMSVDLWVLLFLA